METAKSPWVDILTAVELEARYALTASLDPRFAADERRWYEARTAAELRTLAVRAWDCCNPDGYQMAKSYLALVAGRGVITEPEYTP